MEDKIGNGSDDKFERQECYVDESALTLPLLRLLLTWQSRKDKCINCDSVNRHTSSVAKIEELT